MIRDAVTDGAAERCYQRLLRSGIEHVADPAERIRIGRERLAQEPLQRLVQRGEMEAVGSGPTRQFRFVGDSTMFAARPKPRKEWVSLERLTFDSRLQMRDLHNEKTGEVLLFDEAWVQHLFELRQEKVEFEPIEAVEEKRPNKQPVLWVYSGFHRGEARKRSGENSVECLIYPGTFADAQFYALSENGKQPLPRTDRDCQRAFVQMMDTPELYKRVSDAAKEKGVGWYRAMMAATGLSQGAVGKYLAGRKLRVDRQTGQLVPVAVPDLSSPPPPPPPARASKPDDEPESQKEDSAPTERNRPDRNAEPVVAPPADLIYKALKLLNTVGGYVEGLLASDAGDSLRDAALLAGIAFARCAVKVEDGGKLHVDGRHVPLEVEMWPALDVLRGVLSQVGAEIAQEELQKGK